MRIWPGVVAGFAVLLMLSSGPAFGQATAPCGPGGRMATPQKVEGQIVKVDSTRNKVTVLAVDGKTHEFDASKEALQGLKVGDRIEANLREAPKCP